MNESILVLQEKYYGPDKNGPPMLPHGDDPHAVHPPKRQKKLIKETPPLPKSSEKEFLDPLVASTLPSGFPEELAFRALAAYSLLRTLSTQLALSPFAPTAFLRALYLPIPSNLIGRIHVALIRKLLISVKMGYHFGEKNQPLLVAKKRKIDGISWHLRAGDNLQLLDSISWPVFYDDYCHLTADVLYQSMNDETVHLDHRTIGSIRDDFGDELEEDTKQPARAHHAPSTLYMYEENDVESDDESFAKEDDSDGSYDGNATSVGRRTKKKSSMPKKRLRKRKGEVLAASQPSMSNFVSSQYGHSHEEIDRHPNVFAHRQFTDRTTSRNGNGDPRSSYTNTPQHFEGIASEQYTSKKLVTNAGRTSTDHPDTRAAPLTNFSIADASGNKKSEILFDGPPVSVSQSPNKRISYVEQLIVENPENERRDQFSDTFSSAELSNLKEEIPSAGVSFKEPFAGSRENSFSDGNKKVLDELAKHPVPVLKGIEAKDDSSVLKRVVDINHVIQQFVSGERGSGSDTQEASVDQMDVDRVDANSSCKSVPMDHEAAAWSHFRPLRRLRQGLPYHNLSLINKLFILEFLLDELLMVDAISAEMTTRNHNTSCYSMPFGRLPSPVELENMNNEDWCSVCKQEGDLICCDGCVSSYHRECSGLPKSGPLPEGKWFCPECTLVDPAMVGSLNGGRKPLISWTDGYILKDCARNYNDFRNYTNVGNIMFQQNQYGPLESNQQSEDGNDQEYLCVHGFLFCKAKGENLVKPPSPLPGDQLILHMSKLGSEVCSSWPLVQIPVSQPIFRDVNVLPASAGAKYIASFENYNPCLYANKYSATTNTGDADAMEYEGRWHHAFSFQLWDCLRPDTASDHLVKNALMTGKSLFDPLEIIRTFMLDLEAKLLRAALLDSKWGAVVPTDASLQWRKATQKCKSLIRLAKLFVKLVDAIHPLAFDLSWFNCSRTKTTWQEKSLTHNQNKTVQCDADTDASILAVMRCWQTCPIASIQCLLARDGYSLMDWIKESDPELGMTIRKRRRKHFIDIIPKTKAFNGLKDIIDTSKEVTGHESLDLHYQDDGDGPPVKRLRSSRFSVGSIRSADATSASMSAKTSLAIPRKMKFEETRNDLSGSLNFEPLWPICGRQPFPTYGSFPRGVTRYLARNAGGVVAPFVTYSNDFEVGQVANSHVWRKRMFECRSFEEFLLLASSLETYLDSQTVRRAASYAQRFNSGKNHPNANIIESYRDLRTGLMEHLVSKHKQSTATWVSTTFVDLPVMIHSQMEKSRVSRQLSEESKTNISPSIDSKSQVSQKRAKQTSIDQAGRPPPSTNTANPIVNASTQQGYVDQYNQAMAIGGHNGAYNMMMMMQSMMMQNFNGGTPASNQMQNMMMQNFNGTTPASNQMQNMMMQNFNGTTPASNAMPNTTGMMMQNFSGSTPAPNQAQNTTGMLMQNSNWATPASNQTQNTTGMMMRNFNGTTAASNVVQNTASMMPNFSGAAPASNAMPNTMGLMMHNFNGGASASNPVQNTTGMIGQFPGGFNTLQPLQFGATPNQCSMPGHQMQLNNSIQQRMTGMWPIHQSDLNTPQVNTGQMPPDLQSGVATHNQTSHPGFFPNQNSSQQSIPQYNQNSQNQQFNSPQMLMGQGYYQPANVIIPGSNPSTLLPQVITASQPQIPQQPNSTFQQPANMDNAYSLLQQNYSNSGTGMQPQPQSNYGSSKDEMNQNPSMAAFTPPVPNSGSQMHQAMPSGAPGPYHNYGNFMATNLYPPQDNGKG